MAQKKSAAGLYISYNDKAEKLILRNLSALIQSIRAGDISIGFQVSHHLHTLGSAISIGGIQEDEIVRHVIFTAAIGLQAAEALSISDFVEALGRAGQNYLKRPTQEFHVLFPLNIAHEAFSDTTSFSVGDVEFLCGNWKSIQSHYEIDKLIATAREYIGADAVSDLWHWSSTPLIAKIRAKSGAEAFKIAEAPHDLFRAMVNFVNDRSPFQFQRPEPLARVVPSAGYGTFLKDGTLDQPYVNLEHLAFQGRLSSQINIAAVFEFQSKLDTSNNPKGAKAIFAEALLTYGSALDATDWRKSYLSLWQALEIMSFEPNERYNMGDVVERVCILLESDETISDFLKVCAKRRNDLVHRGQFTSDGQSDVLLLKAFVRRCLIRFLNILPNYPSRNSLTEYFRHKRISEDALKERRRVIDTILAHAQ